MNLLEGFLANSIWVVLTNIWCSVSLLNLSRSIRRSNLETGHNRLLPDSCKQLMISFPSKSTLYNLDSLETVVIESKHKQRSKLIHKLWIFPCICSVAINEIHFSRTKNLCFNYVCKLIDIFCTSNKSIHSNVAGILISLHTFIYNI
jgi:hypothetical protein